MKTGAPHRFLAAFILVFVGVIFLLLRKRLVGPRPRREQGWSLRQSPGIHMLRRVQSG